MSNTVTYDQQYALKLGDLGPPLVVQLLTSSNGANVMPFVLQAGDAVTLRYLDPNGAEHNVSMTFVPGQSTASYSWQSGDLPVASTKVYQGEIRVTRSGEDFPQTFPDAGVITWRVNPAIDGSAPQPLPPQAAYVGLQPQGADPAPANIPNYLYLDTGDDLHVRTPSGDVELAATSYVDSETTAAVATAEAFATTADSNVLAAAEHYTDTAVSSIGAVVHSVSTDATLHTGGTSTAPVISMPASGVTAGSYTNPSLTVDAEGRVTAAASTPPDLSGCVELWSPQAGNAVLASPLGSTPNITGTKTAFSLQANTSVYAMQRALNITSAATANSAAVIQSTGSYYFVGGTNYPGAGFRLRMRFAIGESGPVATATMFAGIGLRTNASSTANPSTLLNMIGVGHNNGDTHLQLFCAGSAAQARIDLGASFPIDGQTSVYQLELSSPAGAASVAYQVTRINDGSVSSGTLTTNLPAGTQALQPMIFRCNGATAVAVTLAFGNMYIEAAL